MTMYYTFKVTFFDHTEDEFIVESWEDLFRVIETTTNFGRYDLIKVELIKEKLL